MLSTSQPKLCPKNPVTKVSGRNTVDNLVSCSMVELLQHADLGLLHRDHRGVRFQHRGRQVALRGDLLVDQGQVVVHVMQVGQQLGSSCSGTLRSMVATTASSGCTAR